jgi:hypothetical protein
MLAASEAQAYIGAADELGEAQRLFRRRLMEVEVAALQALASPHPFDRRRGQEPEPLGAERLGLQLDPAAAALGAARAFDLLFAGREIGHPVAGRDDAVAQGPPPRRPVVEHGHPSAPR